MNYAKIYLERCWSTQTLEYASCYKLFDLLFRFLYRLPKKCFGIVINSTFVSMYGLIVILLVVHESEFKNSFFFLLSTNKYVWIVWYWVHLKFGWLFYCLIILIIWVCLEFLHVKPGKGAAFVRTTLRNYITGNSVEKTFRAGSKVISLEPPALLCFFC